MVCNGFNYGEGPLRLARLLQLLTALTLPVGLFVCDSSAQNAPPADAFQVLGQVPAGPRITPYLQYQLDQAWRQDEARQRDWESIHSEQDLLKFQASVRQSLLQMIGGLPSQKTELNPRITGN